jgi:hypothetical protein
MSEKEHHSHSHSHHSHSHSDSHSHSHSDNNNDCPCFPADCDCDVAVIGINQGTGRVDFFDLAPNDAELNNCTITAGPPPSSATLAADAFRCLCLSGFRFAFSFGPPGNERLVFIRCD